MTFQYGAETIVLTLILLAVYMRRKNYTKSLYLSCYENYFYAVGFMILKRSFGSLLFWLPLTKHPTLIEKRLH